MRYSILKDDLGNHIVVDTFSDEIIGKIRNGKIAARLCQKLNRAHKDDRLSSKNH